MVKSHNCEFLAYKFIFLMLWLVIQQLWQCANLAAATHNRSSIIRCKNPEREALLEMKHVLTFNHLNVDVGSWLGEECCEWQGIDCDHVTGNIIAFKPNVRPPDYSEYEHSNFYSIMSPLVRLKHLTRLDLSGIKFHGTMELELFGSMTSLRYLNLSHTGLTGVIPPQFGNLTNLEVLDLHGEGNYFSMSKSIEWASRLLSLKVLDISNGIENHLAMDTMQVIFQLPALIHLSLSGCGVENIHLSHTFFNNSPILSTLTYLDLSDNHLNGPLNLNIGNLSSLSFLDLSYNFFNGTIPGLFLNMYSLQVLNLGYNLLTNVIGIWGIMWNPCHLKHLDLSYNNIQGEMQLILKPDLNKSICTSGFDLEYLDVSNNHISGTLPSFLGQLVNLVHLDISFNSIQGNIALLHLQNLSKLSFIDISYNSIQGNITHLHLANLSKLSYLDMSYNDDVSLNLSSDWLPPFQLVTFRMPSCKVINSPQWLKTQIRIQDLDLSNTGISGEIHEWFSNASNLISLDLSNNFLFGPLPKNIGSTKLLQLFDVHNNYLSGTLPNWFGSSGSTSDNIDLSSNQLSGFPLDMGNNCTITTLLLNNNIFQGHIPLSLKNCSHLQIIDLSKNRFSGDIPPWIGEKLHELRIIRLNENQLGEAISTNGGIFTIPNSLCNLTFLYILDFQHNSLSGTIPDCWGNFLNQSHSNLEVINFSSNKLSGIIPCSLGEISNLKYLHLSDNKLKGLIPSCLNTLAQLEILNLGNNKLSGILPSWIDPSFPSLQVLRLPNNMLSGKIPQNVCNFSRLHVLDLSNNQLTGNIPVCLGNLTGINLPVNMLDSDEYIPSPFDEHLDNIIQERIAGIMREYITILKYLTNIDLSCNNLTGVIPEGLTSLFGLVALNLSNNHLTGNIPTKIGDMKALETLDLSRNKLNGGIPTSLGNVDSLNYPNFSFNNLSGPIPTSRHLQTFLDLSIYAGNPYLCGDPLPKKCFIHHHQQPTSTSDEDDGEDKHEKMWFYLVVISGFATGFWCVVVTLLLMKRLRHALFRHVEEASDWLYVGIVLNFTKLKKMIKPNNTDNQ